jgi:hypothetical protein
MISEYSDRIKVILDRYKNLPKPNYGDLSIKCNDLLFRCVSTVDPILNCECENLIAGTFYSVSLINSKIGYNERIKSIGPSFTSKKKIYLNFKLLKKKYLFLQSKELNNPIFRSFTFEPNSLNASFSFSYEGNYETHELCFRRTNLNEQLRPVFPNLIHTTENCIRITNETTSFNGYENRLIEHGESYEFILKTTGCKSACCIESTPMSHKKTCKFNDLVIVSDLI